MELLQEISGSFGCFLHNVADDIRMEYRKFSYVVKLNEECGRRIIDNLGEGERDVLEGDEVLER